jgi:hypothetical protein
MSEYNFYTSLSSDDISWYLNWTAEQKMREAKMKEGILCASTN